MTEMDNISSQEHESHVAYYRVACMESSLEYFTEEDMRITRCINLPLLAKYAVQQDRALRGK